MLNKDTFLRAMMCPIIPCLPPSWFAVTHQQPCLRKTNSFWATRPRVPFPDPTSPRPASASTLILLPSIAFSAVTCIDWYTDSRHTTTPFYLHHVTLSDAYWLNIPALQCSIWSAQSSGPQRVAYLQTLSNITCNSETMLMDEQAMGLCTQIQCLGVLMCIVLLYRGRGPAVDSFKC